MAGDGGFAGRLKEAIEASPFDQSRLAEAMGVRVATVSNWVTGKLAPRLDQFVRLPVILGVSADWLLYGTGPRERTIPNGADPFAAGQRNVLERLVEELSRELAKLNAEKASRGEVEDSSDG